MREVFERLHQTSNVSCCARLVTFDDGLCNFYVGQVELSFFNMKRQRHGKPFIACFESQGVLQGKWNYITQKGLLCTVSRINRKVPEERLSSTSGGNNGKLASRGRSSWSKHQSPTEPQWKSEPGPDFEIQYISIYFRIDFSKTSGIDQNLEHLVASPWNSICHLS